MITAVGQVMFQVPQIRQPKHSATVIRLNSLFAQGDALISANLRTGEEVRVSDLRTKQVATIFLVTFL